MGGYTTCNASGERYESMLITVNNVTVNGTTEFDDWVIVDDSGYEALVGGHLFDGDFPEPPDGYLSITGIVNAYFDPKISPRYPADIDESDCSADIGDLNCDGDWNVLDIVALANCVLATNCADLPNGYAGDMNDDGVYNVLDIVTLANCVLDASCGDG